MALAASLQSSAVLDHLTYPLEPAEQGRVLSTAKHTAKTQVSFGSSFDRHPRAPTQLRPGSPWPAFFDLTFQLDPEAAGLESCSLGEANSKLPRRLLTPQSIVLALGIRSVNRRFRVLMEITSRLPCFVLETMLQVAAAWAVWPCFPACHLHHSPDLDLLVPHELGPLSLPPRATRTASILPRATRFTTSPLDKSRICYIILRVPTSMSFPFFCLPSSLIRHPDPPS